MAEAKILDIAASKTTALYCEKGIRRFVEGEYAWANCEAFMIGYVRDGSSIDVTLNAFLSTAMVSQPYRYRVEVLPVPVGSCPSDLAYTRHGRELRVRQPATTKQSRVDFDLAFVAGLGGVAETMASDGTCRDVNASATVRQQLSGKRQHWNKIR